MSINVGRISRLSVNIFHYTPPISYITAQSHDALSIQKSFGMLLWAVAHGTRPEEWIGKDSSLQSATSLRNPMMPSAFKSPLACYCGQWHMGPARRVDWKGFFSAISYITAQSHDALSIQKSFGMLLWAVAHGTRPEERIGKDSSLQSTTSIRNPMMP